MSIVVIDQQNMLDIAILTNGNVQSVFALAMLNGLSVTSDIQAGDRIAADSLLMRNNDVAAYYAARNIRPATAILPEVENIVIDPEGISYWAVNVDFVVQ